MEEPRIVDIGKVGSIRFNVMVVGEIGCGKTTFLESFPRGYIADQNVLRGAALDARLHFIDTTEVPDTDVDGADSADEAVQRPGWSVLNISNVDVLPDYLMSKHRDWVKTSTKLVMSDEERNAKDERVHCLFYFFGPHPVPFYEEAFLKAVSGLVPIVPILAKADSLTIQERERYQQQIQKLVGTLQATADLPVVFDFGESNHATQAVAITAAADCKHIVPAKRDFGTMNGEGADKEALASTSESQRDEDSGGDGEGGSGSDAEGGDEHNDKASQSSGPAHSLEPFQRANDSAPAASPPVASARAPTVFALVCSASESGLREYPWGCSVSAYDERVSDLRRLQRLVFERGNIARLRDLTQQMTIALHQRDLADKQKDAGEEESADGAEEAATV